MKPSYTEISRAACRIGALLAVSFLTLTICAASTIAQPASHSSPRQQKTGAGDGTGEHLPSIVLPVRPKRVLHFPDKAAFGALFISPAADFGTTHYRQPVFRQARGTIEIPAGEMVVLKVGGEMLRHPEALDALSSNDIDVLRIETTSLSDAEDGMADNLLKHAAHLKGLVQLDLQRSDASDAGIASAFPLPELQSIEGHASKISGACFKRFANHKKLKILALQEDTIKQENLHYLSQMPALRSVSLRRTGLSPAGLKEVAKCSQLLSLDLARNPAIGDDCLPCLLKLKELKWIWLNETKVTPRGLLRLRGMHLLGITLPDGYYSPALMKELSAAFPGARFTKGEPPPIDKDAESLFAPMH